MKKLVRNYSINIIGCTLLSNIYKLQFSACDVQYIIRYILSMLILSIFIQALLPYISISGLGNRCPTVWQKSEGTNLCIGTDSNDHIDGSKASDVIIGLGGDDLLRGGPNNDVIQGGPDDDKIFGNAGDDNIQGGPGLDQIYGDSGDDVLFGGFEDDFISAGQGNDELYGGDGDDVLQGGPGADYFDCGPGFDIVVGFNAAEGDTNANNCEDVIQHL
jgi:Ca2+-binding RTX toxin-like protein